MVTFTLVDLDATERLAHALAPLLASRDVVELVGPIGAGKTAFVGGLGRALGSLELVRSPTYTVAHRYELADGRSLTHLDCYRDQQELDVHAWGDLEPYFETGIACVEWPDPIRTWLRDRRTWRIELAVVSHDARVASMQVPPQIDPVAIAASVVASR